MALSFIGKPISLISHSDVRYRGILAGIDPAASTIQLSNVYSMGTESRRPPAEFIPPVQDPYQYIIFRASEVKDLAVDEPTPRRSVHDDPAVLGASAPPQPPQTQTQNSNTFVPYPDAAQPQSQMAPVQDVPPANVPRGAAAAGEAVSQGRPSNSVNNATASMETVERAIGDLRVGPSERGRGGGRRGQGRHVENREIKVPTTDFDFQSSNAKFDKTSVTSRKANKDGDDETNPSDEEHSKEKEKEGKAYNPQSSFFDSLSSGSEPPRGGNGGGGRGGRRGGGGPGGRNRREEERERNVATFGEPGGVGLMGPGAYVGGWGGYGRRGGRPRRGVSTVGGR